MTGESLDELRSAGEKVAEGRFKVDTKRAIERLRHNRLADPSHWVLDVLRAAQASDARRVDLRTDADDVELRFDGRAIPAAAMKDLLNQALGTDLGSEPRVRLFALGIAGALGVGLKRLIVRSGEVSAEFDPSGQVTLSKVKAEGTHVLARKKLSLEVAAALVKGSPERHAVQTHAFRYGPELFLNGKKQGRTPTLGKVLKWGELSASVFVGKRQEVSVVAVDVLGVNVRTKFLRLPGMQLTSDVSSPLFQRNASGDDIVENDPAWVDALDWLKKLSLEELARSAEAPDDAMRAHFAWRLGHEAELDPEARRIMEACPLIPAPGGEYVTVAALKKDNETGRAVYFAQRDYPKGTCPVNTVLLTPENRTLFGALLPGKKREDVAVMVARKLRAAENRATWEAQPEEKPALAQRAYLATSTVDTPKLKGEVGILGSGEGAFVRLLAQGRFVQQGEVTTLAPLRLRATIDYRGNLTDKTWAELPNPKLWALVVDEVEAAYERCVVRALDTQDSLLDAHKHARDLLARAQQNDRELKDLPSAVTDAPLFDCLDGGQVSLLQLDSTGQWLHTNGLFDEGLLSKKRVLALTLGDFKLLNHYSRGRWKDVTDTLEKEEAIRKRLRGPKQDPLVAGKVVSVPFEKDGMHGEVALAADDNQLNVDLYREGFLLESVRVAAQYGTAWAAVEAPQLAPNEGWTAAQRDAAYSAAIAAVRGVERQLAVKIIEKWPSFSRLHVSARHYLLSFIQKEVRGADFNALDAFARPIVEADFIETPFGPTSLRALRELASKCGHLWLVSPGVDATLLQGQAVIVGGSEVATFVEEAIGWKAENAVDELHRAEQRARFRSKPPHTHTPPADAALKVELSHGGFNLSAWLDAGLSPSAQVEVVLETRLYLLDAVPAVLPMTVLAELDPPIDPATPAGQELHRALTEAVGIAQANMLERALDTPDASGARKAVLYALDGHLDDSLTDALAERLRNAPVYECHDGVWRSAAVFDRLEKVSFVTRRFEGELEAKGPVALALDDDARTGLGRFAKREDITQTLEQQLEARVLREKVPQVEQVKLAVPALLTRRVRGPDVEGEVGFAPLGDGVLELFMQRRPLCTVPGALPWPFAAAVNCDALTPGPDHRGVEHNTRYDSLLKQLQELCEGLAEDVVSAWPDVAPTLRAHEAALKACAWLHKRHKKAQVPNPLCELPLLKATDGRPLRVRDLLEQRDVLYAERDGSLLERERFVWKANGKERDLLGPFKLKLVDATDKLADADRVRARPRVEKLNVPIIAVFREPLVGPDLEGEVVLNHVPSSQLLVDLFKDHTLLEHYSDRHPTGGHARLNCDGLTPNSSWTKANRNAQFKAVMAAVETALEKLVAQRVLSEPRDDAWRQWCLAAVRWDASPDGPLRHALPSLELFQSLDGQKVTIGAVFADFHRTRRVAVASAGLDASGALVLLTSPQTLELLAALRLTVKDVSQELRRKGELEADRRARRIAELRWSGDALVRLPVQADGLNGELALPANDAKAEVVLAKQGVRIAPLPKELAPGIAGVLDIDALEVDETWTQAKLGPDLREHIAHVVNEVCLKLARSVPDLADEPRVQARDTVMAWLAHSGVKAPQHLERLTGGAQALACAAVFETVEGEWVSAVALAGELSRRGKLAVFKRTLLTPDTLGALVLEAQTLEDGWLDTLEELLGKGSVERVSDPKAWREVVREEDPPKGSPELRGLERLRRDVRLLRVGALGQLAPDDLEDVRLKGLGGKGAPVKYDVKRKLALLDADHAHVKRALAEASTRRERLYVLLLAMYGAINRALERITDQHEEQLAQALAAHLASNPQLLAPKDEQPS
jgi:hypothetical protein